jgi:uncharacterized protein YeaO (DUF488 family)
MKNINLSLAIAIALLAGTIFTGCQSRAQREITVRNTVLEASQDLQDLQNEALEEAQKAVDESEWKRFKYDAEMTIVNNEFRIADLRARFKKQGITLDPLYVKKIEKLEQQNNDLEKRIKNYREDKYDWQTFKTEFNNDLHELGKALKDLSVENLG